MPGVKTVDPRTLKNHPLNITLYGEDVPDNLIDSIKQHGIRDPLVVCRSSNIDLDGVVVSGRRRRIAAIKTGLKVVPIVEWLCEDDDELQQELIIRNIRSEMTVEQRLRMAAKLVEIEARLAAKRMSRGAATEEKGRAIDKVANQVGLSASTVHRGVKALKNAEELKASGDEQRAEEVVTKLKQGKVSAALAASAPKPEKKPDTNKEVTDKIAQVVRYERLLRESVIATMLALDNKHRSDPEFSRFAKFESIMRGISEAGERPQVEVDRLDKEWSKFLKRDSAQEGE